MFYLWNLTATYLLTRNSTIYFKWVLSFLCSDSYFLFCSFLLKEELFCPQWRLLCSVQSSNLRCAWAGRFIYFSSRLVWVLCSNIPNIFAWVKQEDKKNEHWDEGVHMNFLIFIFILGALIFIFALFIFVKCVPFLRLKQE